MRNSSNLPHPIVALVLGVVATSTAAIFIRFAQNGTTSLNIAAMRLSLATIVLLPFVIFRKKQDFSSLTKKGLLLIILAGTLLAFHFVTWIRSLEYTSVASSVVLVSTTPLWVAVLSPIVLGEKVGRYIKIGIFVALIGVLVVGIGASCKFGRGEMACPGLGSLFQGGSLQGNALAICGALMAAGYLMAGRKLRFQISLITYIFIVYGVAAILLLLMVWVTKTPMMNIPPEALFWCLLLALIPQLLGHSTLNWALKYLSPGFVSISLLGEPIGSTLLAVIFLQEIPGLLELFGGVIILLGILISSKSEVKYVKKEY